jgi:hypothetical protein
VRFVASLILLTAASFAAAPAFAQDTGTPPPSGSEQIDTDKNTVTLGVGGLYIPDYEGSDHHIASAAPLIIGSVDGFNFSLVGNRASIDLIPDGKGPTWDFQAGPVVALDLNRSTKSLIDDSRVRALGKRDMSIEAGGFVGIGKTGVITSPYDKLSLSVSYRKGFTGAQRGGVLTPTINYLTPVSRLFRRQRGGQPGVGPAAILHARRLEELDRRRLCHLLADRQSAPRRQADRGRHLYAIAQRFRRLADRQYRRQQEPVAGCSRAGLYVLGAGSFGLPRQAEDSPRRPAKPACPASPDDVAGCAHYRLC